jgi:hypothetical protein
MGRTAACNIFAPLKNSNRKKPMKKAMLLVAFVAMTAMAQAQNAQEEIIRDMFRMEIKAFFSETMNLTPEEEVKFWPIYNAFREESNKIDADWAKLVKMYVEKYGQHTEAEMQEMLNLKFKVAKNRLKLEEKYYKKIQKQVDMESAVRFVQVQDFIQSAIRFELLSELPVLPRAKEKAAMMEGAGANQTPASNTSQMRKD